MPEVLLIAATTGYQTRAFTDAARGLGINIALATDRCHILENPWGDEAIPVRFDDPEESSGILAEAVRGRGIEGIVAVADGPTVLAAWTAQRLGLPWHSPAAAVACRSKHRMRQAFEAAGLPVPRYAMARLENPPDFPCVLKPLGLSASRGVIRADNRLEFEAAFARIRRILDHLPPDRLPGDAAREIHVEQYIPGREFALEGLMTSGELAVLALFDKPDPLEGPYFEETLYITPSREAAATQQAIIDTCKTAARALGLSQGPVHAEMRVNPGGVYMLEIAARPIGGLCARALTMRGTCGHAPRDYTLEELILLHAIGRAPTDIARAPAASGVMMIPIPRAGVLQSVTGIDAARAIPGIFDVVITAKAGEILTPLPEGAGYPGFIFARAPDPGAVEAALRSAHRALRFDILATLPQLF